MADTDRIKRNVERMLAQNAPEKDIDEYIAAEGVTAEQLRAAPPQQASPDMVMDVAKSVPTGLAEGVIGLSGLPGDIRSMYSGATDLVGNKLGFKPDQIQQFKNAAQTVGQVIPGVNAIASGPSGANIKKAVEGYTGEFPAAETTPGKYVRAIAQNAPSALVPGGPAMRAASVVAPAVASEAAGQAMEGKPGEGIARIAAALAGGVGVGGVQALANAKRSFIPNYSGNASRTLERVMGPDAEAQLSRLGPDAFLYEGSQDALGIAQGIATQPGSRGIIMDPLIQRNAQANARLTRDVGQTLGPAHVPSMVEDSLKSQREATGKEYGPAARGGQRVNVAPIVKQLDQEIALEAGAPKKALLEIKGYLFNSDKDGNAVLKTSPVELLNVRQAVDDMIGKITEANTLRAATIFRKRIDEALGRAVPEVKRIDARFSELMKQSEALERGQQVLATGKTMPRPLELGGEIGRMTPAQFNMLSVGARAEIDRIVGTKANDVLALRQLIQSEGDFTRANLSKIFGRDKADQLFRVIEREAAFRDTTNNVVNNSQTAMRAAGRKMIEREDPSQNSMSSVTLPGMLLEGGKKTYQSIKGVLTAGKQESLDRELAYALSRQGTARDDILQQIRNAQSRRKPGSNMTRDVLVRALMNAQAARN